MPKSSCWRVIVAIALGAPGCAEPNDSSLEDGTDGIVVGGQSDGPDGQPGGSDGDAGGGAEDQDAGGGDDPRFDVGNGGATAAEDGGNEGQGCQRVDVILAVDNSSSMGEEIEALQGPVFDALPAALLSVNGGIEDFHLAVIDACPKPAYFHDTGVAGACNYSTGGNYMSSDSPALDAEFGCVTTFAPDGYGGAPDECIDGGEFNDDDEQAGLTVARSLSESAILDANHGFLRDDALLFVVVITDEDEALVDTGDVSSIHASIVAAKGGDASAVAYLGVAGASN